VILLFTFSSSWALPAEALEEYQMKAAFLYNFAKFVEWPPDTFKSAGAPIVGCVLGVSPFSSALERAANGRMIEDRKFLIRHISDLRQVAGCQILFVTATERRTPRAILKELKNRGILTVGEVDGFTSEGGVANFKLEGGRIRIQINLAAAEREKLRISPKLLNMAQIVGN